MFANPIGRLRRALDRGGRPERADREGGAQISGQHANFIVNLGQAKAADVYALVRLAQDAVFRDSGVWLRPEIELFGRWSGAERAALQAPGSV